MYLFLMLLYTCTVILGVIRTPNLRAAEMFGWAIENGNSKPHSWQMSVTPYTGHDDKTVSFDLLSPDGWWAFQPGLCGGGPCSWRIREYWWKRRGAGISFQGLSPFLSPQHTLTKHLCCVCVQTVTLYLVKWCSLPYEDSTWELKADLDQSKIEEYERITARTPSTKRVASISACVNDCSLVVISFQLPPHRPLSVCVGLLLAPYSPDLQLL